MHIQARLTWRISQKADSLQAPISGLRARSAEHAAGEPKRDATFVFCQQLPASGLDSLRGLGIMMAPGARLFVNKVTSEHAPYRRYRQVHLHFLQLCVIPQRVLIRLVRSTVTRLVCVRDGDVKDLSTQITPGPAPGPACCGDEECLIS